MPEDISIIGIDNADYTPCLYRVMTMIGVHVGELCSIAAKVMDRKNQFRIFGCTEHIH